MEAPFKCTAFTLADGHLVTVAGEVDIATAPSLAETLAQLEHGTVRVDVTEVTFIDSSGLKALLAAHRYLSRNGSRMIICGQLDPLVLRTLEITGLDEVLELESSN
jgi:anti-sigma B factor antagonist